MKKFLLFLAMTAVWTIPAMARSGIGGTVSDSDGQPLPGASVIVKGSAKGTVTDDNGKFHLDTDEFPLTLTVSYLGFITEEVTVSSSDDNLRIGLKYDTNYMDEVVVIGYGTVKKSDLTGSVASVGRDDVTNARMLSIDQALAGKIAGVNILNTGGEPGAGISINIRGVGSVSSEGNEPLYVIDGAVIYRDAGLNVGSNSISGSVLNPLSTLNPADIESIEVLKDASATAIYGSRGANGVVLITTRSGKEGRPRVNFSAYGGVSTVSKTVPVLNGKDYLNYQAFDRNDPAYVQNYEKFSREAGHNWQDELFKNGYRQEYSLSVDGGTRTIKYSFGVGYSNQTGLVKNSDYQRFTVRGRVDQDISKWLKAGINLSYARFSQDGTSSEGGKDSNADVFQQILSYRPINTDLDIDDEEGDDAQESVQSNPKSYLDYAKLRTFSSRFIGIAYLQFKIAKGLSFKMSFNYGETNTRTENFYPANISGGSATNGRGTNGYASRYNWSWDNILTYNVKSGKRHNLDLMAGYTMEYQWARNFSLETHNYPSPFDKLEGVNIGNGLDVMAPKVDESYSSMISWLGRINYNYADRYLLTATIRADGSSKFPDGRKYSVFPSVAFAWKISNERFMRSTRGVISDMKLRLSYGMTGNQGIPAFRSQSRYSPVFYTFNESGTFSPISNIISGIGITSMENSDLTWETTHQYNVGLDLGFFSNRIQLTADAYYKKTVDMLIEKPVPFLTGYTTTMSNSGSLENKGLELTLHTVNFSKKNFEWTTDFNISFNRNKILDLGTSGMLTYVANFYDEAFALAPGQPVGVMYGYKCDGVYSYMDYKNFYIDNDPSIGMRPEYEWQSIYDDIVKNKNGQVELVDGVPTFAGEVPLPGSPKYRNMTKGDNNVNEEDRTFIGRSDPEFYGSFTNKFIFYGVDISIFFQYNAGNDFFVASYFPLSGTGNRNILKSVWENAWRPWNNDGTWPDYTIDSYRQTSSSLWIEDGSYLKLKDVTIGYSLPSKITDKMKINSLRFFITGQNLFTWTNFSWYDPEVASNNAIFGGLYRFKYPSSRTFLIGVALGF